MTPTTDMRLPDIRVGDVIEGTIEEVQARIRSCVLATVLGPKRAGDHVRAGYIWWRVLARWKDVRGACCRLQRLSEG